MEKLIFENELKKKACSVNKLLKRFISQKGLIAENLQKPVSYTLEAGGKRIRPVLVLWCCQAVSGQVNKAAEAAAAAIEMVHTYSLIHDDLPAMDNDDYRRGRLTCHKAFDEATAILAGDGLLTLAFEIIASQVKDAKIAVKIISELAQAAGPCGMVAGQMADLKAEKVKGTRKLLEYIHENKTAKMFRCACAIGAIAGGASDIELKRLKEYGLKIGLGFQIADDILDVSASSEQLGKTAGKDAKAAKCTYPSLIGMNESKKLAEKIANDAVKILKPFGKKADILRQLAFELLNRSK